MTIQTPPPLPPSVSPPLKAASMRRQVIGVVIAAILLTVGLASTIAYQHGMFTRTVDLYFITESAQGMAAGTRVRLAGVHVGTIKSLQLLPDANVKVIMAVDAEPVALLKADASADLVREQLQPAAIELRIGKNDQPLNLSDAKVMFTKKATITEVANDLNRRLAPILDDFKEVSGGLRQRRGDIETMLGEASAASRELAATAKALHAMLADAQPKVGAITSGAKEAVGSIGKTAAQANQAMSSANQTVGRLGGVVDKLDGSLNSVNQSLPVLLKKLESTLDVANQLVVDSRAVTGAASTVMPGVLRDMPQIVEDTRDMVGAAKGIWPLSGRVAPPAPMALPIDSSDAASLRQPAGR